MRGAHLFKAIAATTCDERARISVDVEDLHAHHDLLLAPLRLEARGALLRLLGRCVGKLEVAVLHLLGLPRRLGLLADGRDGDLRLLSSQDALHAPPRRRELLCGPAWELEAQRLDAITNRWITNLTGSSE